MTPMRFLWNFEILWLLCLSENNYENYVMIFDYNFESYKEFEYNVHNSDTLLNKSTLNP